jgi:GT2 family glycosyltransferase
VITYRRPHTLERTLRQIIGQTRTPDLIVVVDNGSLAETEAAVARLGSSRVLYAPMTGNLGPAGAAAWALERLVAAGWTWIYWCGDDGPPSQADTLERLLALATANDPATIGAVAAGGVGWDWSRGRVRRLSDHEISGGATDVEAIAGGNSLVVHSLAIAAAGLPRSELFWGMEDIEYTLRIRAHGLRLVIDADLARARRAIAGRIGHEPRRRLVPRRPIHELGRVYYTTRNTIWMLRSFGRRSLARKASVVALARSVASIARGPRYAMAYLATELAAIRDGYRGRLGFTRPVVTRDRHD